MSEPLANRPGNVQAGGGRKKTVEETYQKKTQHEHILARPDMYIGSTERISDDVWAYDDTAEVMVQRKCSWIPGLYKIFDEILVNAADNKIRDHRQSLLMVDIDKEQGKIMVWNNGEGIPVKKHKEHDLWIPEMIFGHLLTSSNYDDEEKKVTGGRNGYGAKLTNVFSTKFIVETCHRGQKFKMVWRKNMTEHDAPVMTSVGASEEDYTCVTFWPDFKKFNMEFLEDDIYEIMKRRVVDMAGITDASMKVRLNGKTLKIRTFEQYIDLYPTFGEEKHDKLFARVSDRWAVCVRLSNIGHQQVSFVNSIATSRGGNHVKYITDQIVDKVIETAKKKSKGTEVKPHMIKPHLWVFIACLIDNPSFDSQTKETLNTTSKNFGSACSLPQSMIDCILKAGLLDRSLETANSKLTKQMMAKAKSGTGRVSGIPKLEDANDAGGKNGHECTLILTEGDSAKALAVGGLGTIGRDKYGVYPLRGKPLNVRDAGMKKVMMCQEIQAIIKIMGLKIGEQYTSTQGLRYGHIIIMADQDHDGSHIKGLIVNFIHTYWPSLCKIQGFLTQFITPIVKALPKRASGEVKSFFALNVFLDWRRSLSDLEVKNWTIKYYKGLGTSTSKEGKEYFSNLREHKIDFTHNNDGEDDRQIVLAFAKDKVDDRKRWILDYKAGQAAGQKDYVDFRIKKMRYRDFIDKELIQFSIADCERSIPCVVDGLKPGQRKILFSCFKRNLRTSIKVAQLAGYISEHAAYHHGEASLQSTIVGLAQDYVGSNNVPLLVPDGQFGTRLQGGKDCASARYIFTRLMPIARVLFHKSDDDVLTYKDDDGFPVEPEFYVPVIPLVLLNGTSGIGTGFATSIPNYNPWDVITNIRNLMSGKDMVPMVPWYWGFQGSIVEKEKGKFSSYGKLTVVDDMLVQVKELPVGYWTGQYKQFLEEMVTKEFVISFREYHTDTTVDFDVIVHPEVLRTWKEKGIVEDKMDLRSAIPASNLMCFDEVGKLTKYPDAEAIIKAFFIIRLEFYGKRKEFMLEQLRKQCEKFRNMVRFIREVIDGKFVVSKKKKAVLLKDLREKEYKAFPPDAPRTVAKEAIVQENDADKDKEGDDAPGEDASESPEVAKSARDYEYLLGMKLWSLTAERVAWLEEQLRNIEAQIRALEDKTPKDLWGDDLTKLEGSLKEYYALREKEDLDAKKKQSVRKRADSSRVRVQPLSAAAQKLLAKDVEAADKKQVVKRPRRAEVDLGDDDDGLGLPRAPKPKRAAAAAKKRKVKKDSGDEFDSNASDSSDSDDLAHAPSTDDSDDGDDDDVPLATMMAKKQAKARKPKAEVDNDDDFDLNALGMDALESAPPKKAAPKAAPAPPKAAPAPKKSQDKPKVAAAAKPKKPAAPTKRPKKKGGSSSSSEDDDDGDATTSGSSSDPSSDEDSDGAPPAKKPPTKKATSPPKPKAAPAPKAAKAPVAVVPKAASVPRPVVPKAPQPGPAKKFLLDDDDFDFS